MGNLHLVTGYAGQEHVTSADQGSLYALLFGEDEYVLNRGNKFAASVLSNNKVRIMDGDIMMQGRHIRLKNGLYVDLTIESGTQGYQRNDLIVVRYTKDEITGVEDTDLVVIKGTPALVNPADPEYTTGDIINNSATENYMPLYRIPIDGITVGTPVALFEERNLSLEDILTHTHDASKIVSGILGVARGGTGKGSWDINKLIYASAANALSQLSFPSEAGSVLRQGKSGAPYWTSIPELWNALGCSKIATGTYSGTGTYGSSKPNILTFDFEPKIVIINSDNPSYENAPAHVVLIRPSTYASALYNDCSGCTSLTIAWDGNAVAWYSNKDYCQFNDDGHTYYYVAID